MHISLRLGISVALCVYSISAEPVAHTVDTSGLDGTVQFMRVDEQRINKRQEYWHKVFEKKQLKKNIIYGGLGVAIGCIIVGIMFSWHRARKGPQEVLLPDQLNQALCIKERNDMLKMQLNDEALREWLYRRSAQGRVNWIIGSAFESIVCFCITALCTRYLTKSGTFLEKTFSNVLSFDYKDSFVPLALKLLRDTTLWYNSLVSLIKEPADVKGDNELSKKLYIQMARDVFVDHMAFLYSCEDCIAYVQELLVDNDSFSYDQVEKILHQFYELRVLTNDIIGCEESVVRDLYAGNRSQLSLSLLHTIQGLYNEFDRIITTLGVLLYGSDFSLPAVAMRT